MHWLIDYAFMAKVISHFQRLCNLKLYDGKQGRPELNSPTFLSVNSQREKTLVAAVSPVIVAGK